MLGKRIWIAIVVATSVLIVMPVHASASTGPSYEAANDATYCRSSEGILCSASAHADAPTGDIDVDAAVTAPAINAGNGFAQASGWVVDTFRPNTRDRVVRVTAVVHVDRAEATAIGLAGDRAGVELRLTIAAWCTCPGGRREVTTASALVGSDSTAARSVYNETRSLTGSLVLAAGEKFNGIGDAVVQAVGRAQLTSQLALERTVSSAARTRVTELRVELS